MAGEVRMNRSRTVVMVGIVLTQMSMDERRAKGRGLHGHCKSNRDHLAEHESILRQVSGQVKDSEMFRALQGSRGQGSCLATNKDLPARETCASGR